MFVPYELLKEPKLSSDAKLIYAYILDQQSRGETVYFQNNKLIPTKTFSGDGFTIPQDICQRKISSEAKLLYGIFASGQVFPDLKSVSKFMGISLYKINKALKELKQHKLYEGCFSKSNGG